MQSQANDSDSIRPMKIPLDRIPVILATSPNYVMLNNCINAQKVLPNYERKIKYYNIEATIAKKIQETLWYEKEKFLLLGEREMWEFDPERRAIKKQLNFKKENTQAFKTFTMDNEQCIMYTAYQEWGPKALDKWGKNLNNGRWEKVGEYEIDLNEHELIGMIVVFQENGKKKIAMTIYNQIANFEDGIWYLKIQDLETGTCLKKIMLQHLDPMRDCRIVKMHKNISEINWLGYNPGKREIVLINEQLEAGYMKYPHLIYQIEQFGEQNLIIRTEREIDIQLFC